MHVEWFGQSAFALTGKQAKVFIDPFADLSPLTSRGMKFDYPWCRCTTGRRESPSSRMRRSFWA